MQNDNDKGRLTIRNVTEENTITIWRLKENCKVSHWFSLWVIKATMHLRKDRIHENTSYG